MANVNNWLSAVVIPMEAQCRDIGNASNSNHVAKGLTDVSSFGPPLLNLHNGSAIGIMVKESNIVASLAQFVSGLGIQSDSNTMENCSSTFGQVICQFPRGIKLSLLGLHQVRMTFSQHISLGALTIPVFSLKCHETPERVVEAYSPHLGTKTHASTGYIALMLETELDDTTRIGGWIEMNKTNSKLLQWAVTMSDVSEDSLGWAMSLSGMIGGSTSGDHFQAEYYLKFNHRLLIQLEARSCICDRQEL
ncbi:GDSL esterase/lipase [Quillaja saponaria]|uniref:GDSL esterase/lipase n=1 Tax=Quillaja saponaria TaxID=32244 RepID=A0AAD7PU49_QUISA|nr:GDSL esterase/lipase [Quillaja saponaria]